MSIKFSVFILILVAAGSIAFCAPDRQNLEGGQESTGIIFFKGTWAEAVEKAKLEKKDIFLDIYASWCGPCKSMKRKSFADPEVGKYYNEKYINVELDGEVGDGLLLARKFNLSAYPSIYIVDTLIAVKKHEVGYHTPQQLLLFGKDVK